MDRIPHIPVDQEKKVVSRSIVPKDINNDLKGNDLDGPPKTPPELIKAIA